MAESIKDRYHPESLYKVAADIKSVYNEFQIDDFLKSVFDDEWDTLELKDRIMHIGSRLGNYLPDNYPDAIHIIDMIIMNYGTWSDNFCGFFPAYIELYGQKEADWMISIEALERYTQYASSEFAVRSFIIKDEKRMMKQMLIWSKSENEHIRRLASEGCRPALPWGQALVSFKKDPTPILPILEQLKQDPSLYVRKSVANNLNDISKTHPELVIKIANDWYGQNKETDWIIKHGCRTLLKSGNRDVLALFGYGDISALSIEAFKLNRSSLTIGEDLVFSFVICAKASAKVRLEYAIDYVKANGKRNRKIYKISETTLHHDERKLYTKKQSFQDTSTRKHYTGVHSLVLIINGIEKEKLDFILR